MHEVFEIRLFHKQDTEQVAQLFHQTVREINIRDYSNAQIQAWAPEDLYFRNWYEICSARHTFVADAAGKIIGFGELEASGHIDCFYVHKTHQRCGVGNWIYQAIEAKALEIECDRLFVEASITAKPFFQRMGFSTVREQQVARRGECFTNYVMEKFLD